MYAQLRTQSFALANIGAYDLRHVYSLPSCVERVLYPLSGAKPGCAAFFVYLWEQCKGVDEASCGGGWIPTNCMCNLIHWNNITSGVVCGTHLESRNEGGVVERES